MRRVGLSLFALALAGCASTRATPAAPPRTSLAVALPGVSRGAATERVARAMLAQGYQLASAADAGREAGVSVVRTAPYPHNRATTVVLLANVTGSDAAALVSLSARYTIPTLRRYGHDDQPVPESHTRLHGELWARLERLAAAVRGDSAGAR